VRAKLARRAQLHSHEKLKPRAAATVTAKSAPN
jgi:hypothetical protein